MKKNTTVSIIRKSQKNYKRNLLESCAKENLKRKFKKHKKISKANIITKSQQKVENTKKNKRTKTSNEIINQTFKRKI